MGTLLLVVLDLALLGLHLWDPRLPWSERIERFDAVYAVQPDGSVQVTETLTWHFGWGTHHGINRDIITRQDTADHRSRDYDLTDATATSPTGAPTDLDELRGPRSGETRLRIGDPDETVGGTQQYVVSYTLHDVVNTVVDPAGTRSVELYWNVIGLETDVPVDASTVTVTGPDRVTATRCFTGLAGSTTACASRPGPSASYDAAGLGPRHGVTVVASFDPAGFTDAPAPVTGDTAVVAPGAPWQVTGRRVALAVGLGLPFLAGLVMALLALTIGRDRRYAAVTPGLLPAPVAGGTPQDGPPGDTPPRDSARPLEVAGAPAVVAVRFTPPDGLTPALAGIVDDTVADDKELTATVVDLAARGHLTIEEQAPKRWRLTMVVPGPADALHPLHEYEQAVLDALFPLRHGSITLDQRPDARRAKGMAKAHREIYREARARGWFRFNPDERDSLVEKVGYGLCAVGVLTAFVAFGGRWDLDVPAGSRSVLPSAFVLVVGLFVAGAVVLRWRRGLSGRTALGTAAAAQVHGYRQYLATAEAAQIRFEEAESVFVRNLPYAIVLGLTDHWATVFRDVVRLAADSGVTVRTPTWYVGVGGHPVGDLGALGEAARSFASTASRSIDVAPASTGSSGGSGSSGGGGGYSGGGGGGGGSSSW